MKNAEIITKLQNICDSIRDTPELSSNEESPNALERDVLLTDIVNILEDLINEIKQSKEK